MRRLWIALATAVVLTLAGGTAAFAAWSRTASTAATSLTAGDISLSATWATAPTLTALTPGATRQGVAKLTHSGNGRWQYQLPSSTGASTMSGLTVAYTTATGTATSSCTTTAVAADAWSATQANGSTVYVCVTVSLSTTAPSTVQSTPASIAIVVQARNQPTN
ncbi:hypothetical protein [Cellulomonas sp. HZM]|uniref:hypothetical protein n=1 Tax=Cellulomonas sp. HZM TaxID=1454010 RepID=UPI000492F031|nr:hypothetical protein [Cellulomonas sp. HZM]